jgi:hypothetical protein
MEEMSVAGRGTLDATGWFADVLSNVRVESAIGGHDFAHIGVAILRP